MRQIWIPFTGLALAVVTLDALSPALAQQEGREGGVAVGKIGDEATITTFNLTIEGNKPSLDNDLQRELLSDLQQLVSNLLESGQLDASEAGSEHLAEGITEIAKQAPFSRYMLQGKQFTLEKNTGYLIEQTGNLVSYAGFSGGFFTFFLDGAKEVSRPGQFLMLKGGTQECRLLVNGGENFIKEVDMTLLCP